MSYFTACSCDVSSPSTCITADLPVLTTFDASSTSDSRPSCTTDADCAYTGCDQPDIVVCYQNLCYTGTNDSRCDSQANSYDLGDGGWCWDGRRDILCPLNDSPKYFTYEDSTDSTLHNQWYTCNIFGFSSNPSSS